MTSTIEIIVTAAVEGAVTGLEMANQAMSKMQSFAGQANEAVRMIGEVIDNTAGKSVEYANKVEKLSETIGASAEESSKLINVSSELGVSAESLTHALDAAIRKGHKPTIAALGEMSNAYLAIQDPIARTKYLMDNFGRSGTDLAEVMKLGAAGLKAMGDESAATGLVMDEKAVKAAKEYEISTKKLNETVAGLEVNIGNKLIPTLTAASDAMSLLATWNNRVQQALSDHSQQVITADLTYQQYTDELHRAAEAAGYSVDANGNLVRSYHSMHGQVTEVIQANYLLTESQRNAEATLKTLADTTDRGQELDRTAVSAKQQLKDATAEAAQASKDAAAAAAEYNKHMADINSKMAAIKSTEDSWLSGTAGQVESSLQRAGVHGQEYADALGAIDAAYGTHKKADEEQQKAIDELSKKYAAGKISVADFQAGLKDIEINALPGAKAAQDRADESLEKSYVKHKDVTTQLVGPYKFAVKDVTQATGDYGDLLKKQADMDGPIYRYLVGLQQIESAAKNAAAAVRSIPSIPGGSHGGSPDGRASGGAVSAGQTYMVGERGPEYLTMPANGYVTPNNAIGRGSLNIGTIVTQATDARQLLDDLEREANARGYSLMGTG